MQQILTETTKTYRACTCLLLGLTSETTLGTQARQAQASAVLRITSTGVILWNWRRRIIMAWKGLGGLVHLGKNAWNLGSKLSSGRGPGIFEYQESKTPPCPCALPMPALSPPSPSPHPACCSPYAFQSFFIDVAACRISDQQLRPLIAEEPPARK